MAEKKPCLIRSLPEDVREKLGLNDAEGPDTAKKRRGTTLNQAELAMVTKANKNETDGLMEIVRVRDARRRTSVGTVRGAAYIFRPCRPASRARRPGSNRCPLETSLQQLFDDMNAPMQQAFGSTSYLPAGICFIPPLQDAENPTWQRWLLSLSSLAVV